MAHRELIGQVRVNAKPQDAFKFFTPEGERLYVPGWAPEYLHPPDGALREGTTFITRHGGEDTLWLVSRCDEPSGIVDYVRTNPGSRISLVSVRVRPGVDGGSEVAIGYSVTGLSAEGDQAIDAFAAAFDERLVAWEQAIAALLNREPA
jgi:hypothetical protein